MKNLRIIPENHEFEYYKRDQPISFLDNIEDINIIIGANNSRKSRFTRAIIKQELKTIFKTNRPLDEILAELRSLLEEVKFLKSEDKKILTVIPLANGDKNQDMELLLDYFAQKTKRNYEIEWNDIETTLTNTIDSLLAIGIEDGLKTLKVINNRFHAMLNYVQSIYSLFKHFEGKYIINREAQNIIPGVSYEVPGTNPGDKIFGLEITLDLISKILKPIKEIMDFGAEFFPNQRMIYIPVLRTSRMLSGGDKNLFTKTIKDQYFNNEINGLSIETGLDLYEKIQSAKNGNKLQRDGFKAFEIFISQNFFAGKVIEIVSEHAGEHSVERNIKVTIEEDREDIAIYDLGDGVQSVINLLFPIFTASPKTWIFIDEPENHLHPGYQNIFMRAIAENKAIIDKELKFFISTHSNHILSEALLGKQKSEILVFTRRDKNSSNILNLNGNEYNLLETLGVFSTSVLISNCTLWVEGVTDRLYLRAFLYAYVQHLKDKKITPVEGMHYSFIEYAGTNLIHYNFDYHGIDGSEDDTMDKIKAYFINTNIFLLADSDFDKEKHEKYEKIRDKKNFEYYQTDLPEIENLIPKSLLKSWLVEEIGCKVEEVDSCLDKSYQTIKLGKFLTDKLKFKNEKNFRKFQARSGGTLRSDLKDSLAEYTHKNIISGKFDWETLKTSTILGDMVPKIYEFIARHNQLK